MCKKAVSPQMNSFFRGQILVYFHMCLEILKLYMMKYFNKGWSPEILTCIQNTSLKGKV